MSEKDQICDDCKDVILLHQGDAIRIQYGYFNKFKEFVPLGRIEVLHENCYNKKKALALVMEECIKQISNFPLVEASEKIIQQIAEAVRRV